MNVKLFANGGIQMTGVTSDYFARQAMEWLIETIRQLPKTPFTTPPSIQRFSVQLINTDYSLDFLTCFHGRIVAKAVRGFLQPGHLAALDLSNTTS